MKTASCTYARVGGPSSSWNFLTVYERKTFQKVCHVIEVNCKEGWLIRAKLNEKGKIYCNGRRTEIMRERITGDFVLVWRVKMLQRILQRLEHYFWTKWYGYPFLWKRGNRRSHG